MKHWLRKSGSADFLGPFTNEEIVAQLRAGGITTDYEALEAAGQSLGALQRTTDWVPLRSICTPEGFVVEQPAASAGGSTPPKAPSSVMSRYRDAYLVARATTAIGGTVKAIGVVLGLLIAIAGLIGGSQTGAEQTELSVRFFVVGFFLGVVVAVPLYVLGVLVSAQGQVLKATVDSAVHSSPFLGKEDMAKIMSL